MLNVAKRVCAGERGMALILAIGFLTILSIVGALVIRVSTEDLTKAGLERTEREVFYAVDRAVEYSMTRGLILSMPVNGTVDLINDNIDGTATKHHTVIDTGDSVLDSGSVADLGPNDLPAAAAELFGDEFGANYYHVEVKSKSTRLDAGGNPVEETHVDSSIVRLFKRDDDTIFRTSRGG
ncbi:MAG: hypothetical protein C0616_00150 [Desulfuromonas sp.]|nr:MAG: hypothetical protein C0616_00150 [Desulfuromonas sp.]